MNLAGDSRPMLFEFLHCTCVLSHASRRWVQQRLCRELGCRELGSVSELQVVTYKLQQLTNCTACGMHKATAVCCGGVDFRHVGFRFAGEQANA